MKTAVLNKKWAAISAGFLTLFYMAAAVADPIRPSSFPIYDPAYMTTDEYARTRSQRPEYERQTIELLSATDQTRIAQAAKSEHAAKGVLGWMTLIDRFEVQKQLGQRADWLGRSRLQKLAQLPRWIPAEMLFSEYAQKWVYEKQAEIGPNCWYTAMASIFENWGPPRYMGLEEYRCHLKTSFRPIDRPELPGDLLRFYRRGNLDVHAAVFLGTPIHDSNTQIVLTKNGPSPSHVYWMTEHDVRYKIYQYSGVGYYRPLSPAVDPADAKLGKQSPCYEMYLKERD